MFFICYALTTIPQFNTSKVTNMNSMFKYSNALTTIPQLDASKVTDIETMFSGCTSLTNLGGLLNIGQAFTSTFTYDFSSFSHEDKNISI